MRDPGRIDRVIELLRKLWHARQLVLVTVADGETVDLWHVEDDAAEKKLRREIRRLGAATARPRARNPRGAGRRWRARGGAESGSQEQRRGS
jgi:hypothetical protein